MSRVKLVIFLVFFFVSPECFKDIVYSKNTIDRANYHSTIVRNNNHSSIDMKNMYRSKKSIGYAFPDPFNTSLTISFSFLQRSSAKLEIHDILGSKLKTIFEG